MKLSLNWLKRYLDFDMSIEELSNVLTMIGLEVEGVEEVESIKGGLKGVKVGKVLTCEKHPDADKLSVTTVDVGDKEPLQIVCGAPNVDANQKVAVATVGTVLYDGDKEFKIKKGKIRGQSSHGMICAEDELGLGSGHDGIMVLDDAAKIGMDAADYFQVTSDTVFDIGLTPNRSDATSHFGVAKDLYAYLHYHSDDATGVKMPDVSLFDCKHEAFPVKVDVEDIAACPRYSACTLVDVKVKESPQWIRDHLTSIGIKPKNNVVDITNFVLHELGQPLHAFDGDIVGDHIVVRRAKEGNTFVTLDGQEKTLSSQDIMISNKEGKDLCIAGVYGGLDSGVTENTTRVILESAHFHSGLVRGTSTRHQLRTDAAKIYEKGSDPMMTVLALKRAATLLEKYADATIACQVVDICEKEIEPLEVVVRYDNVRRLLGVNINKDDIHGILRGLKMELNPLDDQRIKVRVTTNKADVTREVDVIEEILRIYGFNNIPVSEKVATSIQHESYPSKKRIKEHTASLLTNIGYNEMMGLSLVKSAYYQDILPYYADKLVYINNTSNINLDTMRPEMLLSGLESVRHNINRQNNDLRLYEYGSSYIVGEEGYKENESLTLFVAGARHTESWRTTHEVSDYYDIKKAVHDILRRLGISKFQISVLEEDIRLRYGLRYHQGPTEIVHFGEVKKDILEYMGIKTKVFYAEFCTDALLAAARRNSTSVEEISKFPSVRRDLALVVDKATDYSAIEKIILKAGGKQVKDVKLFDIYNNEEHLGEGKKSYAVSIAISDEEKTLSEKDIDKIMKPIIKKCQEKLGATIRK